MAAGNLGKGVEGKTKVFGKEITTESVVEPIEDALEVLVGAAEGVVVAGIGDDDVAIGCLRGGVDELLAQLIKAYAELSLKGFGFVLDADDGLVGAYGNIRVGNTWFGHHQDDLGTLGSSNGTFDAKVLDGIIGMADASGVDESEGDVA